MQQKNNFTTGFENRGAHGCEEQWNAWDKRVWTSLRIKTLRPRVSVL
jgi:hypothetical protein